MTRQIKRIIAVMMALSLTAAATVTVSAKDTSSMTVDDVVSAFHNSDVQYFNLESMTKHNDYNLEKEKLAPNRDPAQEITDALPSKLDLRNVDGKCYVSPVKNQDPWPTCWSFGAVAAAETSIAYALGHDYNDKNAADADMFDLSERHLAWFMYNALPEGNKLYPSQAGEGVYSLTDNPGMDKQQKSAAIFGTGGYMAPTTTLFSAGIGPVLEKDVPYEGKDAELFDKNYSIYSLNIDSNGFVDSSSMKIIVMNTPMSEEKFNETVSKYESIGYIYMSMQDLQAILATGNPELAGKSLITSTAETGNGDWTVDESYRFQKAYSLLESKILANPAQTGKNGEYVYDANATAMIKNELVNGRAVSFGFKADQAFPGQALPSDSFISYVDENGNRIPTQDNSAIWAQYTFDRSYDPSDPDSVNRKVYDINHAACIVGYDDSFPKEYFNDPNGTLPDDGAWLVKNSWGCVNAENPADRKYWGNGGDGFFWISYYDQGISIPESFSFRGSNDEAAVPQNIDMYDFMPEINRDRVNFDNDVFMANVFTAKNNCTVRFIGIETVDADTTIEYSVYFLNDGAKSPTDGHCLATAEVTFPCAGYHKVDIGRSMPLAMGNKYSIVAKAVSGGSNTVYFNHAETDEGFMRFFESRRARYTDNGNDPNTFNPDKIYSKGVVNEGESFVGFGSENGTQWADWADVTAQLKSLNAAENMDCFTYDNFPIRSYPETELLTATNVQVDAKDKYAAGEEIKGKLVIGNNTDFDFNEEAAIELVLNIGASGKETTIATVKGLKAHENRTFDYTYTVTQPDVIAGKVVSTLKLRINGNDYDYNPVFGDILSFTAKVTYSYVVGDADGDGKITVGDVTAIQKKIAQLPLDFFNSTAADIDGKGLDITDATAIQRYLAEYKDHNNIGKTVIKDKYELPFIPA